MPDSITIIYANALGWRVQSEMIKEIAGRIAPETRLAFKAYRLPFFLRPLLKDTYGVGLPKRLNLFSSLAIAGSVFFRYFHRFEPGGNVIFLGGTVVGLLAHAPEGVHSVVVIDMTFALAVSLFNAKYSKADIEKERIFFNKCSIIFAMSTACASSIREDYRIDESKIEIYLPPVQIGPDIPFRRGATVKIGFVGGDFERKGGPCLMEAFSSLSSRESCELVIVSEGCPPTTSKNIAVHGKLPHRAIIDEILPQLDIFCLPTTQDCSGLAIAEAMAAGLPVVATDLPGIADLVIDGRTGIVVPVGRVEALADALAKLISDEALRQTMSRNARAHAVENFSAERGVKRLVDRRW